MGSRESSKKGAGGQDPNSFRGTEYLDLYRFLLRHVPRQEVNDVIQEAFVRFWGLEDKELIRNPQGYMHGIAWKVVCDFRTERKKQKVTYDSGQVEREVEALPVSTEDPICDQVGTDQELERVLEGLSPKQRVVLLLHRGHGYTDEEIAAKTGLSRHTVKKYTTRAIQRIRERDKGSKAP